MLGDEIINITIWNANGLRSLLNKGGWEWIKSFKPEVLCLQEVRAQPNQLTKIQHELFSGYEIYWLPAERSGYSGVLTMSLQDSDLYKFGLGIPEFDAEGRIIATRHDDIMLFNTYFPSGRRGQERVAYKLDFYAGLLNKLDELHASGEKIIVAGDFNTAHQEIDLRNPKANRTTSGFLPEERKWVSRYLESGFVDIYRELYPERVQYTWWTYRFNARQRNIGWRLDYFLVSKALVPLIRDVIIHDDVLGSDHCPVTLSIDLLS